MFDNLFFLSAFLCLHVQIVDDDGAIGWQLKKPEKISIIEQRKKQEIWLLFCFYSNMLYMMFFFVVINVDDVFCVLASWLNERMRKSDRKTMSNMKDIKQNKTNVLVRDHETR